MSLLRGNLTSRITAALRRRRVFADQLLHQHLANPPPSVAKLILDFIMNDLGKLSVSLRWACILLRSGVKWESNAPSTEVAPLGRPHGPAYPANGGSADVSPRGRAHTIVPSNAASVPSADVASHDRCGERVQAAPALVPAGRLNNDDCALTPLDAGKRFARLGDLQSMLTEMIE